MHRSRSLLDITLYVWFNEEIYILDYDQLLYLLYHILVIFVCLIFFCNWKIPYINASDVGGQPGT